MKKIIYTDLNNNFCLVTPSDKYINDLEFVALKSVPEGCEYFIVNDEDIPKEPDFFNALCIVKDQDKISVVVNIEKAKAIHLDKFRAARTGILQKLDVDFMRSVENANTQLQQEIAAKKQALRDVTKTELPDDLEGIKKTWPEILGEKPF